MSNSEEPEVGIDDDKLPDDLQPAEDNPLAESLDDGETVDDLLEDGKPAEQSAGDDSDDDSGDSDDSGEDSKSSD
ncbi:MAG: hypothetical protein WKF79_16180 [Nocardioides sp.]